MKTVVKGKKKISISVNGDTIRWSSLLDYQSRTLPTNEAEKAAKKAAADFNCKQDNDDSSSSSISELAQGTVKATQNEPISETQIPSVRPSKKVKIQEDAEIQCELDIDEPLDDYHMEHIKEIYRELDSVFIKRIADIQSKVPSDVELQIKTYEEWCENLIKCNGAFLESIQILKNEFQEFALAPLIVSETELKFEHDRNSLAKLLQRRAQTGKWYFEELVLQTLPFMEILKRDSDCEVPSSSHRHHTERRKSRLRSPFTKPKT